MRSSTGRGAYLRHMHASVQVQNEILWARRGTEALPQAR